MRTKKDKRFASLATPRTNCPVHAPRLSENYTGDSDEVDEMAPPRDPVSNYTRAYVRNELVASGTGVAVHRQRIHTYKESLPSPAPLCHHLSRSAQSPRTPRTPADHRAQHECPLSLTAWSSSRVRLGSRSSVSCMTCKKDGAIQASLLRTRSTWGSCLCPAPLVFLVFPRILRVY